MAGLPLPGQPPTGPAVMPPPVAAPQPTAQIISLGGVMSVGNLAHAVDMQVREAVNAVVDAQQQKPVVTGLSGRIESAWTDAKDARREVEADMIEALLARRGKYTPAKEAEIKADRQPVIYMMVAGAKMRQIEALLRDTLIGTGAEKPWTVQPTPDPELPPEAAQAIVGQLTVEIMQAMASGFPPTMIAARERVKQLRDEIAPLVMEEARKRCARMESKMEDQLVEGGFLDAMSEFISDLATFKTAFVCGPVVRNKPALEWSDTGELKVQRKLQLEWERLDPFCVYPARYARNIQDGPLILKRRLSRMALTEMIGTEGFSEEAIRKVLELYGTGGLRDWLAIETERDAAEGKLSSTLTSDELIDALQYYGYASGQMLRDWGMTAEEVPDVAKEYSVEAWKIGPYVIKAVLNPDPLGRRPVYADSFYPVPGSVWGMSPYDLLKDCQGLCNAAARALAANMGISSGPQVGILSNRIPPGEEVTEMFPWKIWSFESDPMGSTAAPISFFQPQSNANELMMIFERFSQLADEAVGIPRYMAGFNGGEGGAGRTASGISMMIGNASKVIKQVVGGIDLNIIQPVLEWLYLHNMRFSEDPDLKGDVKVVARGAMSLVAKEAAQVRNNEFLQIALNSPVAQQIMGIEGVAEVLRGTAKQLEHNPDKIVPPLPVLKQRMAEMQMAQMAMMQAAGPPGGAPSGSKEELQDGTPTTDNFSPKGKP